MLLKYSGIISMLLVWILVVFPSIIGGLKSKTKTISQITNNRNYLFIINLGLISGAIFQFLFLIFIIRKFIIPPLSLFVVVYFSTIIAALIAAYFPYYVKRKTHTLAVEYYFIVSSIALLFFGYIVRPFNLKISNISLLLPIIYFLGVIIILKVYKKVNALIQTWAFSLLSVWTFIITFY